MSIEIKELNENLIRQANNNSFGGMRGDLEVQAYKAYCEKVISWKLSERKTQKIINKIYDRFSKVLSLDAQHVSVAVAGGSNYNAKKLDKSDKILANSAEFCEWFDDLEDQATKKPFSKIEWLIKEIIWGTSGEYSVVKQWKELAARSRKDFEILYEELSKKYGFKKTSIPYKIYHNLLEIEEITQCPIYSDDDFSVYEEQGKICIKFRMKPEGQLLFALRSKHFSYVPSERIWKANSNSELIEWSKTIAEQYEKYI